MGRYDNTKRNQYNSTPRKVFDSYIDRMAIKLMRQREDHRADVHALLQRIVSVEQALQEFHEHLQDHCERLQSGVDPDALRKDGKEEL